MLKNSKKSEKLKFYGFHLKLLHLVIVNRIDRPAGFKSKDHATKERSNYSPACATISEELTLWLTLWKIISILLNNLEIEKYFLHFSWFWGTLYDIGQIQLEWSL